MSSGMMLDVCLSRWVQIGGLVMRDMYFCDLGFTLNINAIISTPTYLILPSTPSLIENSPDGHERSRTSR